MVGTKYFPSSIIRRPYSDNNASSEHIHYENNFIESGADVAFRQRNQQSTSHCNSTSNNEEENRPLLIPNMGSHSRNNNDNNNSQMTWSKLNVALFA
eukprot:scaffold1760_cov70-Skeletonema_marinoi.AAC.1